jgi:hypothetical protein
MTDLWEMAVEDGRVVLRPTPDTLAQLGLTDVRFFVTSAGACIFEGLFDLSAGTKLYRIGLEDKGTLVVSVFRLEATAMLSVTSDETWAAYMLGMRLALSFQPHAFVQVPTEERWGVTADGLQINWDFFCALNDLPSLGICMVHEEERRIEALSPRLAELEIEYLLWMANREAGVIPEALETLGELLKLVYANPDRYQRMPKLSDARIGPVRPLPYQG